MPLPAPPLPDLSEALRFSPWAEARTGLKEHAEVWFAKARPHREELSGKARHLAEPSLGWKTLGAIARTGGRLLTAAGPGALAEVLATANEARRVRAGDKPSGRRPSTSIVERAQEFVAAGGPAYVKLGQFIATARGILPNEWVEAFEWCRDEVAPLDPGVAERVIERSFGEHPLELFASFHTAPMAAASIAQVHEATLLDGTEVVVKVRRPGLRRQFYSDIRVMALMSAVAERALPEARMANLSGFVELFAQIVLEELDFRLEAVNIVELALASESSGHDYVNYPRPIPDLVASNVLVMERVPGVRYTDAVQTYPGKVDGQKLLRLAIQSVLEQTLIYGVYHGDLHAGNVFIDPNGDFSLVDFGIVGRLNAEQRASLVRFMLAFAQSDVRGQIEAMREFGAVPPDADVDRLVKDLEVHAVRAMEIEVRAGGGSADLNELTEALGQIIRLLSRSGFVAPKELVLFFKNLLYLNGFAAALAPDVNLLDEIQPIFGYFMGKYGEAMNAMTTELGTEETA
ncbi:MAG TPA: AarF/UbiB family protein [Actinomycetota bacterium]|nr:AarF/UbiB family protein [Actinomycetota bacterium]